MTGAHSASLWDLLCFFFSVFFFLVCIDWDHSSHEWCRVYEPNHKKSLNTDQQSCLQHWLEFGLAVKLSNLTKWTMNWFRICWKDYRPHPPTSTWCPPDVIHVMNDTRPLFRFHVLLSMLTCGRHRNEGRVYSPNLLQCTCSTISQSHSHCSNLCYVCSKVSRHWRTQSRSQAREGVDVTWEWGMVN